MHGWRVRLGAGLLLAVLGLSLIGRSNEVMARQMPPDRQARAREVVERPDVTYTTRIIWDCSARTFERAVEDPVLMGALWQAYGFAPAYRISGARDSLHVVDPTGLLGDALLYERGVNNVRYVVLGKLDHWVVPVLNTGTAVFDLSWHPSAATNGLSAQLDVYVRAGSGIGSVVLRLVRPLLARHVDNRISLNLLDVQTIMSAVERDPDRVAQRLEDGWRTRFEAVFGE